MIKKCADEGRKPQVADFGEKRDDSSFLNQLQNGVNRWIREIQKVRQHGNREEGNDIRTSDNMLCSCC